MSAMTTHKRTQRHAEAAPKRDHLWVLVIIAGFALYDVWTAWSQIGNKAGFAHGTGWTLTVIVEVFWLYVLWAWLGGAVGPRSRKFARRSAAGVFVLSLVGQASSRLDAHRLPPPAVVVFVSVLPVIVLALIAFLVHYRQLDRTEAAAAEQDAAAAAELAAEEASAVDERIALRAELDVARESLAAAEAGRVAAQDEAAESAAKAEALARKLAAIAEAKRTRKPLARPAAKRPATQVPNDVDAQAEALSILAAEPDITGAQLGLRVGKSERWGQMLKNKLATTAAAPQGQEESETP